MIRTAVSAIALIAMLGACAPNTITADPAAIAAAQAEQSAKLNAWFDAKYEEQLQFSPIGLTFQGRKDKQDQIDCFTFACADEQLAWQKAATDEMKATFDYAALVSGAFSWAGGAGQGIGFMIHRLGDSAPF